MPAMLQRRWTEDEVRQLIDKAPAATPRYELVDGELLVTPSPTLVHQRVARELMLVLHAYVKAHGVGEVLFSPSDVRLARELVVQPDLYVVPPGDNGPQPKNTRITRLLLAIEIASPSSARYDRVVKRRAYQAAGVPEYWIADADARTVERWRATDARPEIEDGTLEWLPRGTSEPCVIDLRLLFATVNGDA